MNILPKKSWHVRNWRNIERVRKDEEKAAEEERERERKVALAESETRTTYLRNKARGRSETDQIIVQPSSGPSNTAGHINFFQDEEEGKITGGFNKEHEQEKKEEKEKQEKAIGLLTYLGQSAVETQNEKPWYYKPPKRSRRESSEEDEVMKKKRREECHMKKKLAHDPMQQMESYIRQKHKVQKQRQGKHREHIKDKHDKHHRKDKSKVYGKKTIEDLRAERHRREEKERDKAQRLLSRMSGETATTDTHPVVTDERQIRYNSQFNPDFVRKRK